MQSLHCQKSCNNTYRFSGQSWGDVIPPTGMVLRPNERGHSRSRTAALVEAYAGVPRGRSTGARAVACAALDIVACRTKRDESKLRYGGRQFTSTFSVRKKTTTLSPVARAYSDTQGVIASAPLNQGSPFHGYRAPAFANPRGIGAGERPSFQKLYRPLMRVPPPL